MSEERKGSLELNWINKDKSLLYEYDEDGEPFGPKKWVDKDDLRVAEPRPLKFIESQGTNPIENFNNNENPENMLVRGDNLLALKSLLEKFKDEPKEEKIKSIYIDPPFNIGRAFESYDDNYEHSEWLSMMKDRLELLKKLLRNDGVIFVHIDHHEVGHLKVLMDEIFGRNNFIQMISIKVASPAGFKTVNPGPVDVTEYILYYAKDKSKIKFKKHYVSTDYDDNYDTVIKNPDDPPKDWETIPLYQLIYKRQGIENWDNPHQAWREAEEKWGDAWKEVRRSLMAEYALENPHKVISIRDPQKASEKINELKKKSREERDQVFVIEREDHSDIYIMNGGAIKFYEDKIMEIDGEKTPTELLTDFWEDISWAGIANEGGVRLKNGKKPEKLIKRILKMSTEEGDIVLDSFLGSGTTTAVAHKMNRRWIGIELKPSQFEKSFKRMKKVIDRQNPDRSGISKNPDIDWKGGGNFSVFEIGESILSDNKEINWSHSTEELAKSVFWMFDYSFKELLEFQSVFDIYLGQKKEKFAFSIISEDAEIIRKGELDNILDLFKEEYGPNKEIEIYTNYGVGVDEKDLPNNLTIRKVPDCILEKYKLGEE